MHLGRVVFLGILFLSCCNWLRARIFHYLTDIENAVNEIRSVPDRQAEGVIEKDHIGLCYALSEDC